MKSKGSMLKLYLVIYWEREWGGKDVERKDFNVYDWSKVCLETGHLVTKKSKTKKLTIEFVLHGVCVTETHIPLKIPNLPVMQMWNLFLEGPTDHVLQSLSVEI